MSKARDLSSRGGLTQVIPTSVAVGSGSGSVAANGAVTFTGATSISVNGAFTPTYNYYVVSVDLTQATLSDINFRYRENGTDNTSASYNQQVYVLNNANTFTTSTALSQTSGSIGRLQASGRFTTEIKIMRPFLSLPTSLDSINVRHDASSNMQSERRCGTHNSSTSFDGITIFGASMTGTFRVYGYNNG
jgi:hypothetical protein